MSQVPPIGAYEVKWLDTSNGPVSFDKSERFRRSTESLGNKAHQETRVCKHLVESTTQICKQENGSLLSRKLRFTTCECSHTPRPSNLPAFLLIASDGGQGLR